jgi:hypothetical protein
VQARAVDVAGQQTIITESLWVDVVAPSPVTMTLRADGSPVTAGETVPASSPELTLTWGDNSAAAQVLWHTRASHHEWLTVTVTSHQPGDPATTTFYPGEAEQVEVTLVRRDPPGNPQAQRFGVVTIDTPATPDFISLTPAAGSSRPALGWLESDCSLMGVDRRSDRQVGQFPRP